MSRKAHPPSGPAQGPTRRQAAKRHATRPGLSLESDDAWPRRPTSSSSARTAATRSAPTSPNARTAAAAAQARAQDRARRDGHRAQAAAHAAATRKPRRETDAAPRTRRLRKPARSRASGPTRGAGPTRRSRSSSLSLFGYLLLLAVNQRRRRPDRQARRRVVARRHDAVPLRQRLVRAGGGRPRSALFGWLLERRHGPLAVLALFVARAASAAPRSTRPSTPTPLALGGNGAALALLCAWAVPDLAARAARGEDYDGDLLGAAGLRRRAAADAARRRGGRARSPGSPAAPPAWLAGLAAGPRARA